MEQLLQEKNQQILVLTENQTKQQEIINQVTPVTATQQPLSQQPQSLSAPTTTPVHTDPPVVEQPPLRQPIPVRIQPKHVPPKVNTPPVPAPNDSIFFDFFELPSFELFPNGIDNLIAKTFSTDMSNEGLIGKALLLLLIAALTGGVVISLTQRRTNDNVAIKPNSSNSLQSPEPRLESYSAISES
ncbi:hypothetical protein TI03_01075, partial [Achromatium sp. WMS1]